MAELNELIINGSNYTFEDDVARGLATTETDRAREAEQSLQTAINNKVDKVAGKGLSTNDYTNEEKAKLAGLDNYDDTQVRQLINEEKAARQQGDNALSESVTQEETRAKDVEQTLQLAIDVINGKMPAQATAQNQLADKEFVNSSISTATADFKGTYNSLQEMEQVTANANDYAFVIATDAIGNTVYKRYKWVEGTGWSFEYDLNNSSFTAAQWAAIQSGITAALVTKLTDLPTNTELNQCISTAITTALGQYYTKSEIDEALGGKQNTIDDLASIRSGAQAGSTAVQPSTLNNVVKNTVAESGVYDVSANNDNTKFESLSALLSSANINTLIPTDIRKGGMSIKFVQSSDNKYMQYRLMSDTFNATPANWQGVDDEPATGSNNLIKSGSVYNIQKDLEKTNSAISRESVILPNGTLKSKIPTTTGVVSGGDYWMAYDYNVENIDYIDIYSNVARMTTLPTSVLWGLYATAADKSAPIATGPLLSTREQHSSCDLTQYPTRKILRVTVYVNQTTPVTEVTYYTTDLVKHSEISNVLRTTDVINSLDSELTDKPLSAAQGKALNGKLTTKTYITGSELKSKIPTSDGTLTSGASIFGRKDYSLVGVSGVVYIESDAGNADPTQWTTAVLFAIYDSSNHFIVAGDLLKDNIRQSSIDLSNYPNATLLRVTCSFSSGVVSVYTNEDKYASKEELIELQDEVDSIRDSVSVELPSEIIMVKGARVELFTRAFVKCFNPYIYHIEPVCLIGKAYPRYILFKIQDEWVGHNYTLTINVRNNDGKIIATSNTVIKVINKATSPVSMKNVLVFGSSLMAKGYVTSELKRRLTETSGDTSSLNPKGDGLSNISFVGRKVGSRVDTIHQEGTGGWAWEDYAGQGRAAYRFYVENVESVNLGDVYSINGVSLTVVEVNIVGANEIRCTYSNSTAIPASGTLTKVSGDGDATITYTSYDSESYNPFYYNGGLDFENYANLYCDGHIDYLIGYTGTNLVGQSNVVSQTINNIKAIANAYHADFPNGKFLIVSQALPDPTGGMGADYGCSSTNNYYAYAKVVWELAAAFNDLANDDNYKDFVVLVPNTQQFDCEYSYPYGMVPVNNRSSETVRLGQNGLHPMETAEYQVSDSIYSVMHKLLSL